MVALAGPVQNGPAVHRDVDAARCDRTDHRRGAQPRENLAVKGRTVLIDALAVDQLQTADRSLPAVENQRRGMPVNRQDNVQAFVALRLWLRHFLVGLRRFLVGRRRFLVGLRNDAGGHRSTVVHRRPRSRGIMRSIRLRLHGNRPHLLQRHNPLHDHRQAILGGRRHRQPEHANFVSGTCQTRSLERPCARAASRTGLICRRTSTISARPAIAGTEVNTVAGADDGCVAAVEGGAAITPARAAGGGEAGGTAGAAGADAALTGGVT